jgi:hypothetical protein
MQLFADEPLSWGKTASAELEEDATQWPRQVLTELFRVLPEVSEYTPEVKFMHLNEEQGYALGVVVITNATNTALTTGASSNRKAPPKALVPVVVKNGRLCPLDTVMSSSGKMYPLAADRLREVLYRPEPFELLSDDWNDSSIWQLFSPPGRGDFGTGTPGGGQGGNSGVQYMMGPGMKSAGLLGAIEGTILEPHLQELTDKLASDPGLVAAATRNPFLGPLLQRLGETEVVSAKTAMALEGRFGERAPAQVVQMAWDGDAYVVKTANRDYGVVRTMRLDRGSFIRFAGEKLAARVDTEGSVVASAKADEPQSVLVAGARGDKPRVVDNSGRYTVYEAASGKPHTGFVFTNLVDTDGNRVPIAVFICEEGAVVQDQIAGTTQMPTGPNGGDDMPNDPPKGEGIFVAARDGYDFVATVPLTVRGSISGEGSTSFRCIDLAGEEVTVIRQRGQQAVIAFPKQKQIMIPYNSTFIATGRTLPELIGAAPDEAAPKTAASLLRPAVEVRALDSIGDRFTLNYRHMPKLASALPMRDVPYDDALFGLCVAGCDVADATKALGMAASSKVAFVPVATDIGMPPEVDRKKVAERVTEIRGLRTDLVKEAAVLPDAMTVDAILSLDFINSENVRTFVSMIPYLEKSLNRLCELVFAARLGLSEIPETAGARAARGLNDVIRGLKSLALRQIDELP